MGVAYAAIVYFALPVTIVVFSFKCLPKWMQKDILERIHNIE